MVVFFFGWPIRSKFVVKQLRILSTWSLINLLTSGHERKRKTCCETAFNIFCAKIKTFVSKEWKSFYFCVQRMKKLLFFVTKEVAHVSVRKAVAVGSQRAATVFSICIAQLLGGLKTTRQIHITRGSLLRRCYVRQEERIANNNTKCQSFVWKPNQHEATKLCFASNKYVVEDGWEKKFASSLL